MKIYISSDMEGCTGVVSAAQADPGGQEYSFGRAMQLHDLDAAVKGAFDGGAERVIVNDAHGSMTNVDISRLGRGVHLVSGSPKLLGMVEEVGGCGGAVFLGYHAMAGTEKAVLDHSYDKQTIYSLSVNGRKMGEAGFNALLAGVQDVPVIAVSGDCALCIEAGSLLGENVETIPVKEGLAHAAALCLPPEESCEKIYAGVKRAAEKLKAGEFSPFTMEAPYVLDVGLANTMQADAASLVPGAVRIAPRALRFETEDALELRRVLYSVIASASAQKGAF